MKRIIFTLALAVLITGCYGFAGSTLKISIHNQSEFNLIIDGTIFRQAGNYYSIADLAPGNHAIEITRFVRRPFYNYATVLCLYDGMINIPGYPSVVEACLDPQRRLIIQRITPLIQPPPVCGGGTYQNNFTNQYDNGFYQTQVVCDNEFEQMKHTIASRTFDSFKLSLAKEIVSQNQFTSGQIAALLQLMTFESSKLELAKFAYNNTIDKNNFYRVYDVFTFESTIQELQQFIYGRS